MIKVRIKGEWNTKRVWLDGRELLPVFSQTVWNHSPDGFAWGYSGSGPAQLALAILLEFFDRESAKAEHQKFKRREVANWPQEDIDQEVLILFEEKE